MSEGHDRSWRRSRTIALAIGLSVLLFATGGADQPSRSAKRIDVEKSLLVRLETRGATLYGGKAGSTHLKIEGDVVTFPGGGSGRRALYVWASDDITPCLTLRHPAHGQREPRAVLAPGAGGAGHLTQGGGGILPWQLATLRVERLGEPFVELRDDSDERAWSGPGPEPIPDLTVRERDAVRRKARQAFDRGYRRARVLMAKEEPLEARAAMLGGVVAVERVEFALDPAQRDAMLERAQMLLAEIRFEIVAQTAAGETGRRGQGDSQ
ncbi:MAG: hypothetical protein ACYS15_03330 [Planctomycetota bacterium]